jgi:hypothetical protein
MRIVSQSWYMPAVVQKHSDAIVMDMKGKWWYREQSLNFSPNINRSSIHPCNHISLWDTQRKGYDFPLTSEAWSLSGPSLNSRCGQSHHKNQTEHIDHLAKKQYIRRSDQWPKPGCWTSGWWKFTWTRSKIPYSHRGIIWARGKPLAIWREGDWPNIIRVPFKGPSETIASFGVPKTNSLIETAWRQAASHLMRKRPPEHSLCVLPSYGLRNLLVAHHRQGCAGIMIWHLMLVS